MTVPLSILDLAPPMSGGDARDALLRTLDLAHHAERFGYHRYWVAEHHLTPGVASSQPALLLGQIAAATERIRLGSGAVQSGLLTPLAIVEQFGMLDALHPGRFDLGIGRSAQRRSAAATAPPTRSRARHGSSTGCSSPGTSRSRRCSARPVGSSGGESARQAGERGLPFAANYHVAPAKVLEAADAYRAASARQKPSPRRG